MHIKVDKSSPIPLYKQVKLQLRSHFIEANMEAGSALPDIKSIADIAGVSLATVDKALKGLIDEKICYRRPKQGTFIGNLNHLNEQKAICGICHSSGLNSFENDLIQTLIYQGISEAAARKNIDIFFLPPEPSSNISFYLARSKLDLKGVIMLHWGELQTGMKLAQSFPGIKFVYLNYNLDGFELTPPNVYGIFNDDYSGAYHAVEHLITAVGHRNIAALSTSIWNENYRQRLAGYRDALLHNGIMYKSELVYEESSDGYLNREVGEKMAGQMLKSGKLPTACFCVNDSIAEGVVRYLRSIGEDGLIEVFGYDNLVPHISRDYGFGTVKINFNKMGERAVDILINNQNMNFPKVLNIAPQLLIRKRGMDDSASCASRTGKDLNHTG